MTDDGPRWLDDDEPTRRRPRAALVLAGAVVPWLVVVGLLVRGAPPAPDPIGAIDGGGSSGRATAADQAPEAPATDGTEDPGPAEAFSSDDRDDQHVGDVDNDDDDDDARLPPPGHDDPQAPAAQTQVALGVAEALVVAITRAWLSDAGPDIAVPGIEPDRRGYLEHVAVERIEVGAPDLAVATVTVVLLEPDDGIYSEALLRRAAVPLTVTATTVHPAGPPWWLTDTPDLTPIPPTVEPVADDDEATGAVDEALERAGYRDATVHEVGRATGGTLVAEVTARTDSGDRVDGPVWLQDTGGDIALLGHHRDPTT